MQDITPKLISLLGLFMMLLLAWVFSENRKRVHGGLSGVGLSGASPFFKL